jgi:hypothetical protein
MKEKHLDIDIEITRQDNKLVMSLSRDGNAEMKSVVAELPDDISDENVTQVMKGELERAKAFVTLETQKQVLFQGTTFAVGGLHALETMIEELRKEVIDLQAEVMTMRGEKKIITPGS